MCSSGKGCGKAVDTMIHFRAWGLSRNPERDSVTTPAEEDATMDGWSGTWNRHALIERAVHIWRSVFRRRDRNPGAVRERAYHAARAGVSPEIARRIDAAEADIRSGVPASPEHDRIYASD